MVGRRRFLEERWWITRKTTAMTCKRDSGAMKAWRMTTRAASAPSCANPTPTPRSPAPAPPALLADPSLPAGSGPRQGRAQHVHGRGASRQAPRVRTGARADAYAAAQAGRVPGGQDQDQRAPGAGLGLPAVWPTV